MSAAPATAATRLVLEDFFTGWTRAWGAFQDRFGTPRQRFRADVHGAWDDAAQTLTLTERFHDLGAGADERVWVVEKLADGVYRGSAGDVVGTADIRTTEAGAVHLSYRLRVPIAGRTWALTFDDWMIRVDAGVLLNRATVSKMGVTLGTAVTFFTRTDAPPDAAITPPPGDAASA
ncbi:Protein of unknown function [Limimonas halophila]|uniref:DUF3833 domain-containing protein n=1 Tax=Limimonas halophila TaxID=1082479 RepID=A0A1G7NY70_9PROT|nr:DUF3833 family protein [Limimonas halophila]SDF78982.1 Protein of unknown function [Limimonas halophila]